MKSTDQLSIGQVAERSGYATSAIRFYEAQGLFSAERLSNGRRVFDRSILRRLAFIRAARNVGIPLEEIAEELNRLPEDRTPTKSDWDAIAKRWRKRLDGQIFALSELRDNLSGCIGCGCLSLRKCAVANPDDVAAEKNPEGAANWPEFLTVEKA